MKKLLLTSALVASSLLSFAQTPVVPNGDFENWSTGTCGDKPTQYVTYSELLKSGGGNCPSPTGVTKSTTKYSGTYALQLTSAVYTVTFGGQQITEYLGNIATLASNLSGQGVAFNGRPKKLVGYTKFTKAGTDTLGIDVEIYDANGGEVAFGELTISATQAGYTKFEITLVYDATNTNAAAELFIGFGIGNDNDKASPNTVALIDALSFEYATTSTVNYASTSPINIYAANKNINFSENVSDVHVVDMVGANKMQETATTKTLDVAALTTGMYIVTYKYNDAYFSKKVVIE